MNNRPVLMCLLCPMRMSVPKVQMECWEKKESRKEKEKHPCAPGRYRSSQHNVFTLLLLVIGEKSLYPHDEPHWPLPSSFSDFASRWGVRAVFCPSMRQDSY
jgi:hypothetical protein